MDKLYEGVNFCRKLGKMTTVNCCNSPTRYSPATSDS